MKRRSNRMLLVIGSILFLTAVMVVVNVFFVAIMGVHMRSGTDVKIYADSSNMVNEVKRSNRGFIYDRNGTIIAQDNQTYNLKAILSSSRPSRPNEVAYVQDPLYTSRILAPILDMDEEVLFKLLTSTSYETEIGTKGRNLSKEKKEEIEALKLPGIEFSKATQRYYPLGVFASNLIGFAQQDENGKAVGKMGIELIYDEMLTGTDGYRKFQADKFNYILPGVQVDEKSAVNGQDVYLTLDRSIQEALEQAFKETYERFHSDRAWGAVMEVDTGKMLAWGQSPSFNPNSLENVEYNNFGAQLPYEPGSTLKVFTYAAAMDAGVYDGSKMVDSSDFYYSLKNGYYARRVSKDDNYVGKIVNASSKNWGTISYDDGLIYSSNTLIANLLTNELDPDVFEQYLDKFGFFKKVDTDGIADAEGKKQATYASDKLSLGFGQSSTVTTLQLMQAFSAIFSDGTMVKPYFVEQVRDAYSKEISYQAQTEVVGNPIKPSSAKQIQELMGKVINVDYGTGKYYQVPNVDLIGKTGTAQVSRDNSYETGYTIASVILGFPADDPKIMIYYAFEGEWDRLAHVDTDAVRGLIRKVSLTYNLTNQQTNPSTQDTPTISEVKQYEMPALTNHTLDYVSMKLDGYQMDTHILGSGNEVIAQFPKEGSNIVSGQKIFLLTDPSQFLMPDLYGWTRTELTGFWSITGVSLTMDGYGAVISQSVPANSSISSQTHINVNLE